MEESTNGTATDVPAAKKTRVDRVEIGYAQALGDVRKLVRRKFTGDEKSHFNDLLDALEDGREAGLRLEAIASNL